MGLVCALGGDTIWGVLLSGLLSSYPVHLGLLFAAVCVAGVLCVMGLWLGVLGLLRGSRASIAATSFGLLGLVFMCVGAAQLIW